MNRLISFLFSNKALALFDQGIYSITGFASTLILARALTPTDFGLYAGMLVLLMLWVSLSNALVIQPFQVSQHRFTGNDYVDFLVLFQLTLIALLTGGLMLITHINVFTLPALANAMTPALSFTAFFVLHDFLRKFFLAKNRVGAATCMDSVVMLTFLTGLCAGWYRGTLALTGAFTIAAIAYAAGSITGLIFQRPGWNRSVIHWSFISLHLAQGKWLVMTALIQWWSANMFILTSGILLGAEALGAFRLVQSFFGILSMLLQTYENYVLPQVSKLFQSSAEDSRRYLRDTGLKSLVIFGSGLILVALFPKLIILALGGSAYVQYSYVVQGMALLYLVIFIGYPIRVAIRIHIMNREYFLGYVLTLVAGLVSFHYLIETFALWGVIIGLIANQLILLACWQYFLAKKSYLIWR